MRKTLVLFATLFFAVQYTEAQSTYTISECVQYALNNHNNIKMSKNDFQSAIAKKNEGRSGYLPQVNGQIKWDDNLILQTTVLPAGTFGTWNTRTREFKSEINTTLLLVSNSIKPCLTCLISKVYVH